MSVGCFSVSGMALLVGELEALEADLLARDLDGDEFDAQLDLEALLADCCPDEPVGGDGVTGWLAEVLAKVGGLAAGGDSVGDAVRIDRIAVLERIKASAAAAQAAEIVAFGRSQVEAQRDAGVDYRRLGRGIAVFDCSLRSLRPPL